MGEIERKEQSVPGIGVSGMVMCPFFKGACLKQGCEMWCELFVKGQAVGRCSFAWMPKMIIELRQSIEKAKQG